jgi:hypothetical protein
VHIFHKEGHLGCNLHKDGWYGANVRMLCISIPKEVETRPQRVLLLCGKSMWRSGQHEQLLRLLSLQRAPALPLPLPTHVVEHPCGQCEVEAVHDAHQEDVTQPPAVGRGAGGHTVLQTYGVERQQSMQCSRIC